MCCSPFLLRLVCFLMTELYFGCCYLITSVCDYVHGHSLAKTILVIIIELLCNSTSDLHIQRQHTIYLSISIKTNTHNDSLHECYALSPLLT